ncbi:MAG: DUF6787 family protein [Bacteroidota bacterium]
MMNKAKARWQIVQNWHWFFPVAGVLISLFTAYYLTRRILHGLSLNNTLWEWPFTLLGTIMGYYIIIKISLWCFKKLEHKWIVKYRWEMIAIFIVFAITGSVSARLAAPILDVIGLSQDSISGWIYWPIRIIIILPIYQILLVFFGWMLGQFRFFWDFEKKMLSRLGMGFLFK